MRDDLLGVAEQQVSRPAINAVLLHQAQRVRSHLLAVIADHTALEVSVHELGGHNGVARPGHAVGQRHLAVLVPGKDVYVPGEGLQRVGGPHDGGSVFGVEGWQLCAFHHCAEDLVEAGAALRCRG